MDMGADSEFDEVSDKIDIDVLENRQENYVKSVYSSVDKAVERELNRLYVTKGVISTCKPGCFHCCGQYILTNIAEAKALVHYIKRNFSRDQIEDLRIRTKQWHDWDEARPGRYRTAHIDEQLNLFTHCYCPILVDGECSAYPMRPTICRTHFVCSDPSACRPFHDPESIEDDPLALASVIVATNPFSVRIRAYIESAGFDFSGSIMLLPHWLAIEMNWDFAILP
jgi:Fe-S-cluster containining protein